MTTKDIVSLIFVTVIVVVPIHLFIAQPFVVNGESMSPTFETSDYLIIDRLSYRFDEPQRGDVVVFRYPLDRSKYFIKRIIGLPGERITVSDSKVKIYNNENENGFELDEPYVKYIRGGNTDITVEEGQYFVLGDNRLSSSDSRVWGPILKSDIIGRAYVRLFPFSEIDYLPGKELLTN